ncbi:hypothetical protein COW36_24245 [bacterium (Candidatus Blackallbacteria) CG17_big_fil_post_rev_8_21_14_2_50_48_46]|uniref:CAAX prenyl protease 2/Lysostaphin resistance protein A-like domain-containing protein n=1 Tax=bacterium (Candidatus Blackallbacteria) CG17_big_fil_post_rev_8_21_14_2_50_48_46 TaxID=2014261 RepID=A0A2M7FXH3_9BACT|nr:MAG: hypothetical protein COW64_19185 [bacterium (Candidatus Blackallbacteria) CG18_big_fil_WC_8_21_14_2_50_49_26]PIW13782.1 MAG: hypothetical protein COW36_24245 [bacterium (Candidatus Blackallbacteria) CG17_big_fil_post_rev_8_21_14_2_50_48_46]PIW45008.1 MAG: hypothetical protein COW20_21875 [bacterium (Candidatus Blackallbacteria) CG13_big_fil_rev_8_21_14_2_50_49_14]
MGKKQSVISERKPNFEWGWLAFLFLMLLMLNLYGFDALLRDDHGCNPVSVSFYIWFLLGFSIQLFFVFPAALTLGLRRWPLFHGPLRTGGQRSKSTEWMFWGGVLLLFSFSLGLIPSHDFNQFIYFQAFFRYFETFKEMPFVFVFVLVIFAFVQPLLFAWLGLLGIFRGFLERGLSPALSFIFLCLLSAYLYQPFFLQGSLIGAFLGFHYLWKTSLRRTLLFHQFLNVLIAGFSYGLYLLKWDLVVIPQWLQIVAGVCALCLLAFMFHFCFQLWRKDFDLQIFKAPPPSNVKTMTCPFLEHLLHQGFISGPLKVYVQKEHRNFAEIRLSSGLLKFLILTFLSFLCVYLLDLLFFQVDFNSEQLVFFEEKSQLTFFTLFWAMGVYTILFSKMSRFFERAGFHFQDFLGPIEQNFDSHWVWKLSGALVLFILGIIHVFQWHDANAAQNIFLRPVLFPRDNLHNLMVLLLAVVIAPIVEEFLFRGLLLHRLASKSTLPKALFKSSLYFGLMHLQAILYLAWVGRLFGVLYVYSRSLKVSILAHASYNLLLLLVVLLSAQFEPQPLLGLIMMGVGGAIIMRFVQQHPVSAMIALPYSR